MSTADGLPTIAAQAAGALGLRPSPMRYQTQ